MTVYREWQAQLQVALDSQCVGMLRLETGALKATYTNTLKSAQATIAMPMVVAGRRAAEAAIDKLQAVTRYAANPALPLNPGIIPCEAYHPCLRILAWSVRHHRDLLSMLASELHMLYTLTSHTVLTSCICLHGFACPVLCSELAQQPSKLPDFITFRLHVRALKQQQEDLLVALPAQVADLYASVTAWGFRLPHNDQVKRTDCSLPVRQQAGVAACTILLPDKHQPCKQRHALPLTIMARHRFNLRNAGYLPLASIVQAATSS